jgi:hypothetical protein
MPEIRAKKTVWQAYDCEVCMLLNTLAIVTERSVAKLDNEN